jgi:hypothetical protein
MGVDIGGSVDQKSCTLLFKFSNKLDMRSRKPEADLRFTFHGS